MPSLDLCLSFICPTLLLECIDGDIRLADGPMGQLAGRVEICFGGVWGTVCDNQWDNVDAVVVCKQLTSQPNQG